MHQKFLTIFWLAIISNGFVFNPQPPLWWQRTCQRQAACAAELTSTSSPSSKIFLKLCSNVLTSPNCVHTHTCGFYLFTLFHHCVPCLVHVLCCDTCLNATSLWFHCQLDSTPPPFLFSKSFTSKHWATLSFALLSSSMGKSYLMLSSWLVLQNMISFPPGSNVHHPSHLQLLCGRNEACGRRCISVFWVLSCISVFLLRRLDHNGISGRAAGSSRSGEIFGGIRGKQLQRLIYRQPPAFLQKSSRIWH